MVSKASEDALAQKVSPVQSDWTTEVAQAVKAEAMEIATRPSHQLGAEASEDSDLPVTANAKSKVELSPGCANCLHLTVAPLVDLVAKASCTDP